MPSFNRGLDSVINTSSVSYVRTTSIPRAILAQRQVFSEFLKGRASGVGNTAIKPANCISSSLTEIPS